MTSKSDSESGFEASGRTLYLAMAMDWCRVLPPTSRVGSCPRVTLGFLAAQTSSGERVSGDMTWYAVLLTWGERQPVVLKGDLCIGEDQPGSLCTTADVKVADLHRGSGEAVTASTVLNQLTGSLSFAASNGLLLRSLPIGALWNSFSLLKNGSLKRFNKA